MMNHNLNADAKVFFQKIGVEHPSEWQIQEYVRCAEIYQRDARAQALEQAAKYIDEELTSIKEQWANEVVQGILKSMKEQP